MEKKNIKPATIARLVVLALVLGNQVAVMLGVTPVSFSEDDLYASLSTALTVLWSVWMAWKNNSITPEAIHADAFLAKLREDAKARE